MEISFFSRKREIRTKQAILKGVYEDNLRIIGKRKEIILGRRPFFLNRLFLSFCVVSLVIMAQNSLFSSPFSREGMLKAGVVKDASLASLQLSAGSIPDTSEQPMAGPADTADFRSVMNNKEVPVSRMFGLEVKTIMIDPGHGGADQGTSGQMGTKEKDLTLDIAKRLRELLRKDGNYRVLMTREDDSTVPLHSRVEMTRVAKADLFISIHLNYLPKKPINIIETYYFGPSSDEKILMLAEQENSGSKYGLSDFKDIVERLGKTLKLQESREFAYSIQKNLFTNVKKENGNAYNFGVKRAPFVVLLGVDVPAVLAEVSCLSNSEEERELNTQGHRENLARYLEAGILDYLNKGEADHEGIRRTAKR